MVGNKYEETKHLKLSEVAKLIRADLKLAFPGVKFSVRCGPGRGLDIKVMTLPESVKQVRNEDGAHGWMHPSASAFLKSVEAIADAYNFDHSRIEEDYFHTRFYNHPAFASNDMAHAVMKVVVTAARDGKTNGTAIIGDGDGPYSRTLGLSADPTQDLGQVTAILYRVLAVVFEAGPMASSGKRAQYPCAYLSGGGIVWETIHGSEAEMTEASERLAAAAKQVGLSVKSDVGDCS